MEETGYAKGADRWREEQERRDADDTAAADWAYDDDEVYAPDDASYAAAPEPLLYEGRGVAGPLLAGVAIVGMLAMALLTFFDHRAAMSRPVPTVTHTAPEKPAVTLPRQTDRVTTVSVPPASTTTATSTTTAEASTVTSTVTTTVTSTTTK